MRLEGVDFTTFGDLPPIVNASGNVVVTGHTVGIDVEKGEVRTTSGVVSVDNAAFAVPDTSKRPSDAIVEVQLSGGAAALGAIANADPLRALDREKVKPGDLSGTAQASVSVHFPLRPALTDSDIDWKVTIDTKGVTSARKIEGRNISDANVKLIVTPDDVSVYGKAKIEGVAADVSLSFPMSGSTTAGGDRRVRLLIDDDARKKLGVGLDEMLSGSMSALVSEDSDGATQHYDLDLRRARVVLPGIGWTKGIGVPATLTFDLKPASDGYQVQNLVFKGDGFGFSGSATLDSSYNLQSADIDRLSLRAGDAVSHSPDARQGGLRDHGARPVVRSARADRLRTRQQRQERRLPGPRHRRPDRQAHRLQPRGHHQRRADAGFGRRPDAEALLQRPARQQPRDARLRRDAGRNVPQRIGGGRRQLAALHRHVFARQRRQDDHLRHRTARRADGRLSDHGRFRRHQRTGDRPPGRTQEFERVRSEPRSLQSHGRPLPPLRPGPRGRRRPDGRLDGRRDVQRALRLLHDARSPSPGPTCRSSPSTTCSAASRSLAWRSAAARSEGLIGVTFKVEGPIAQPEVAFNPLSAVAPGIFRKIFEFQRPQ